MAQLIFYDDKHVYEVDGVRLPSVSEILRFISRETYADINQYTLDNAADRGKAVHKAIETIIKMGEAEVADHHAGYVKAFVKLCEDKHPVFVASERAMACDEFAGTLDIVCLIEGKRTIIDVKTVCTVNKPLVKAQLNLYRVLAECNGLGKIDQLMCLQLKNTGKYTAYPVAIDMTEANACLSLHKSLAKKHDRGMVC